MVKITVQTVVNENMEKVWDAWINPKHIVKWDYATDTWETPYAENDLRVNGKLKVRMQAKDKSVGFDLVGTYTNIIKHKVIEFVLENNRQVITRFEETTEGIKITQTFDAENTNLEEMQLQGWQAILDNFKKYVENY